MLGLLGTDAPSILSSPCCRFDSSRGHRQERDVYLMHLRTKSWLNASEAQSRKRKKNFENSGHHAKIKKEKNNNFDEDPESKDQSTMAYRSFQCSEVNSVKDLSTFTNNQVGTVSSQQQGKSDYSQEWIAYYRFVLTTTLPYH